MSKIGYYILWLFIKVITLLPLGILYLLSYLLFFVFYIFPGYRKKITRMNLTRAFPEKSLSEIKRIERKFYLHLADLFIETLKAANMSERELKRRFHLVNPELPKSIMAEGRDILAVGGHFNNWEWMIAMPLYISEQMLIIYKPLKNKRFDNLIFKMRSRFGVVLTPMSLIVREIINCRNKGIRTMSVFIADQTPPRPDIKYWTNFLNQDTPVFLGTEKVSVKFKMAVLYLNVRKVKRGYYELTFEELFRDTSQLPEYTVTEAHVRKLEQSIQETPEHWIWTHRRWKYKREDFHD